MSEYEKELEHFFHNRPVDQILDQKLPKSIRDKDPYAPPRKKKSAFLFFADDKIEDKSMSWLLQASKKWKTASEEEKKVWSISLLPPF